MNSSARRIRKTLDVGVRAVGMPLAHDGARTLAVLLFARAVDGVPALVVDDRPAGEVGGHVLVHVFAQLGEVRVDIRGKRLPVRVVRFPYVRDGASLVPDNPASGT